MKLTADQQQALDARGNVLVIAGAGTGKTRTLVERCLHCLLKENPRASLDEMLMVTFTDAAAAEMRQRIRQRLDEELVRSPSDRHCQEQLALFDTAHIGTLHSFCLELIRQHFYELEIDPQVTVMREEEAHLLAEEQLDKLLDRCYSGGHAKAGEVQALIQDYSGGLAHPIRGLIRRLHNYSQTLPNPAAWFQQQRTYFEQKDAAQWSAWLIDGVVEWRTTWLERLQRLGSANEIAQQCAAIIRSLPAHPSRSEASAALDELQDLCRNCPRGKKSEWIEPLTRFVTETEFLQSLAASQTVDPLEQDWAWVSGPMGAILDLATEFGAAFGEAKRELGLADFHDLEQYALRLLWDNDAEAPTEIAQGWRRKLRYIFVDEYQDINAAQDKIIQALSREGVDSANRFLVGDVKQSIYRFRLANPAIFQRYAREWRGSEGSVVALNENFRSREGLLRFINSFFAPLMQQGIGGVAYDREAQLRFGAPEERNPLNSAADRFPRVELHVLVSNGNETAPAAEEEEKVSDVHLLQAPDKEARLVGLRLKQLRTQGHLVRDQSGFRPFKWSDVAILLRAPAGKSESYAKEFSRLNIPLEVARGGFYDSREITDLVSLLQVLDNPLQDLPVLAVLRSPLVGLTVNELAQIRLAGRGRFWSALIKWHKEAAAKQNSTELSARVNRFLDQYSNWRAMSRQLSISKCIDRMLAETHYGSWLLTQRGGDQAYANVQQLLRLAQQFDRFQRQGLFRFLEFTKAQQDAEADPGIAPAPNRDAVRLMSIHQSKGLEFPIVVLADLGKPFNVSDLQADVILDENYGLCPQVKPPNSRSRYPSLPYWLARRRQLRELLGEEMRLLYVGMTRAEDTLILTATMSESRFARMWKRTDAVTTAEIMASRSYADWLGLWFAQKIANQGIEQKDRLESLVSWFFHERDLLIADTSPADAVPRAEAPFYDSNPRAWAQVQARISREYPHMAATQRPAKTTVSMLRKQHAAIEAPQPQIFKRLKESAFAKTELSRSGSRSADLGIAHHTFLQLFSIDRSTSVEELRAEADRLVAIGNLSAEEVEMLNFEAIARFWSSDLGIKIRRQSKFVHRELAFTARFFERELAEITGEIINQHLGENGEFVVVQGIADLVVLFPEEIWLVDFKSDDVGIAELDDRARLYEPQLQIYSAALGRIYSRPVTQCWLHFLVPGKIIAIKSAGFLQENRMNVSRTQAADPAGLPG